MQIFYPRSNGWGKKIKSSMKLQKKHWNKNAHFSYTKCKLYKCLLCQLTCVTTFVRNNNNSPPRKKFAKCNNYHHFPLFVLWFKSTLSRNSLTSHASAQQQIGILGSAPHTCVSTHKKCVQASQKHKSTYDLYSKRGKIWTIWRTYAFLLMHGFRSKDFSIS